MPFHSLYSELEIVLERLGISSVEGILMDLGVSLLSWMILREDLAFKLKVRWICEWTKLST